MEPKIKDSSTVKLEPGQSYSNLRFPRSTMADQKVFIDRILDNPLEKGRENKIVLFRYWEPMYDEWEFQAAKVSDFQARNMNLLITI